MKSSYFYLFSALVLTGCQSKPSESVDSLIASADEAVLRAKRIELTDSRKALDAEIKRLDQAIAGLNAEASLPLVSAFSATAQRFEHFVSFQGTVKTMQNILVYPELPGQLIEIIAREGEKVKKDQIIARLDDGGLAAQLAQAQSQLALAQTVYDRQKRLWDQEIGSEIQYLQAQTQFESSVKVVEALNVQLEKSIIRAPFDGTIDQIFKEPG
ncbi:MAG: biotin/lipoyl-binding protein, partial [Bacteroidetes bacterium]|nr:biotin/lipoyl-binding protein [Bacteroidota bacterium]